MKIKNLLIICLFLVGSVITFAQQAPIVEVTIDEPAPICVEGGCVDLTATYFVTKPTTDYDVESIIYQNLYSYTGGTVLVVTTDDVWSPIFQLPFSFNFYGQNYTQLLVGSNGVITFDIAGVVPGGSEVPGGGCAWSYNQQVPNTGFPVTNSIYGVYQDTNMGTPPIQDPLIQNVNYYVGGTAPNRYFVANFNRLPQFQCNGTLGATVDQDIGLQTSQIVIYETTNIIDVFVRKRSTCATWNGGNGVIGVQNQAGTAGDTPPGRNTGAWGPVQNEGWRFIPSGVGADLVTLTWKDEAGTILGTGNPLNVCVEDEDIPETFTAEVTYINGTVTATATDEIILSVAPPLPVLDPLDLTLCTSDPGPYPFNNFQIDQNIHILNGAPDYEYDIYYFTNETAANNLQTSQALTPAQLANFSVPDQNPVTIYALIIETSGSSCHNVRPFTIQGGNPSGTFSYPDDGGNPGFCVPSSTTAMVPVLDELTPGGTYTVEPTTGLLIDPDTGVLDLTGAVPATYTVTYTIPEVPGACPEYTTQATVLLEGCVSTNPVDPAPVCEGTPTFSLTTSDAGPGATYTWSGPDGFTSNDQNPVNVPVPTAAGDYTYSVFATITGVDSPTEEVILTVYPLPNAEFSFASTTICTNEFTYLPLSGTPGATVTINDGASNNTVLLDAGGSGLFTTDALTNETIYTITQVESNTNPVCDFMVPTGAVGSVLTVSVGLPTATLVGFTDPVICSGTSGSFLIQGTSGATVTYTDNAGTLYDVELPADGQWVVDTPIFNVNTTTTYNYSLVNIETPGDNGCSSAITGETATLTVNALPTATFATTTPTVCQDTPATINFTGTPGAIVTYNFGGTDYPVTLDASGNYPLTTDNLPDPSLDYIFTLVSVEETLSGVTCSADLTGSLTIEVDADPVFVSITPVSPQVLCAGASITLEVEATGDDLSFQWYKDDTTNPVGTDSATFTIPAATDSDAGEYFVVISGSCGTPVTSTIVELILNEPTVIVDQSTGGTYCEGDAINLFVDATGVGLTFQWFKGTNELLSGETNPTLDIAAATLADAGTYRCVISNPCPQQETTQDMVVIVNQLPAITVQPVAPSAICVGESINLSVSATGTGLSYQWFLNSNPIPTGTSAIYNDPSVTLAEAGDYTVVVSGTCAPAVTSTVATVVVNEGATIVQDTQALPSDTVCSGDAITLSILTSGGSNPTYQWQIGGVDIPGAIGESFTINSTEVSDTGIYTCVISSDSCPSFSSSPLAVTVNQAPAIADQSQTEQICVGEAHSLFVDATGTNLTYQWYKDTFAISGATSNIYTMDPAALTDSGDYYCEISSTSCLAIQTTVITLTVRPLPVATIANGTEDTICSGESSEVVFTGTPGAVVIYNIVGVLDNETVQLNAVTGEAIVATGTLTETTTYELVSVTYTGVDACSQDLTGSATVTVNQLPEVTIEDGYICVDPITGAVTRTYRLDTELNDAEYLFEWSDANGVIANASSSFYDASAVGQYAVKITDVVTLCEQTAFATVDQSSPPISFDYTVNDYFSQNPTVVITAQPAGDYEYQLDYGPFQESNVFDNISMGEHTITVRDPQACDVLTDVVTIIDYPKYFTPNGDGINDTWKISRFGEVLNAKIYIFDRFGKLVKEISTEGLGWDGTYNGQPLPATDYWFTLDYEEAGIRKEFKAHFSIKR